MPCLDRPMWIGLEAESYKREAGEKQGPTGDGGRPADRQQAREIPAENEHGKTELKKVQNLKPAPAPERGRAGPRHIARSPHSPAKVV